MKKMMLLVLMTYMVGMYGIAYAINDKVIGTDTKQLPETAQQFLENHFKGIEVSYIKVEKDFLWKTYDVKLTNGFEIEFDGKGNWLEVDGERVKIPEAIIPEAIKTYLNKNYPGKDVISIESGKKGYKAKLSTKLELKFNNKYEFVGFDD